MNTINVLQKKKETNQTNKQKELTYHIFLYTRESPVTKQL